MKLEIPEIRSAAFEIKTSIKNIKKMHAYQLELANGQEKIQASQDGTLQELTKAIALDDINTIENAERFISEILSLTDEEVGKLQELERKDFMDLQSKLVLLLQGYGETEINDMFKEEVDSAEKKVQALKKEKSTTTTN